MTATFTTESPRFSSVPAEKLQREMKWMETSQEVPPIVKITTAAVIWMLQVDAFRIKETDLMLNEQYQSSLDEHRYILSQITTNGEKIYLAAKQNKISRFLNNFTIEDIEATIDSLRITFLCEYGEKNSLEVNAGIESLFSGKKFPN